MRVQHAISVMNRTVEQQHSLNIFNDKDIQKLQIRFLFLLEKKVLSGN